MTEVAPPGAAPGAEPAQPPDLDEAREALADLHRARRRNHREVVHWVDALYRVYLTAFGAAAFVVVASTWFGDAPLDEAGAAHLAQVGPAWLGLVFAVLVGIGLRSGGRGGPLNLEAPAVQHELLAPVDRRTTLSLPAIRQLRFAGFGGAVVGGCLGILASRRLPDTNGALLVISGAATVALGAISAVAAAMTLSGRRLGIWVANGIALLLLAWTGLDLALDLQTSPLTLLADLAFWPLSIDPFAVVPVALVVGLVAVALTGLGGTSLETARRRAGLVSQLRFAVTLQDIRTVVLLRRQLAQETPRTRPWFGIGRTGRLPATWRRDWACYLRFPAVRVVRVVALAVIAGVSLGLVWHGMKPAVVVAGLALFFAGYEAVEPIAQEVDHPTRWDALALDPGMTLLRHLPAAIAFMLLLCAIAAATTLFFVPANVVWRLSIASVLPIAAATAVAAALSTILSSSTSSTLRDGVEMSNTDLQLSSMDPNTMGFMQVFRLAFAPGLCILALLPLLAAGADPENPAVDRVSNLAMWTLILVAGSVAYLRFRRPSRI